MIINHKSLLKYILFLLLFFCYSCQNCLMKRYNFYLIPLLKEKNSEKLYGLHKYDYNLIFETDPLNENDNYHMIFLISFPININIELSTEIIYKFETKRRFCIKDLIKESDGKLNNLEGKLSEYNSEIQILQNIWIKIEKILLFKDVDSNEKRNKYFLLTEYIEKEKNNKKYLLIKKMKKTIEKQFFQIIRVNINRELEKVDCKNDEDILKIGTEFTIQEIFNGDDSMLREGRTYKTFAASDETEVKSYNFENIENLICLIYEDKKYFNKFFFSSSNSNNKI